MTQHVRVSQALCCCCVVPSALALTDSARLGSACCEDYLTSKHYDALYTTCPAAVRKATAHQQLPSCCFGGSCSLAPCSRGLTQQAHLGQVHIPDLSKLLKLVAHIVCPAGVKELQGQFRSAAAVCCGLIEAAAAPITAGCLLAVQRQVPDEQGYPVWLPVVPAPATHAAEMCVQARPWPA